MRVIPPVTITNTRLTSSSVAEPHATETAYNAGTTYAIGAEVVVAADHRKYESLQAGNVGNTPASSPSWWFDLGPTNRWAMLDILRNTRTVDASPVTVVLTPGVRINSLALLGLDATSVTVSMTNAGDTVYERTVDLNTREVLGWYDYFFEPFTTLPSMVLWDLPPFTAGILTIDIENAAGDVGCGAVVIGSYQYIGETEHQAESDALNFSTVERDEFGNAVLVPRRSIPKVTQTVFASKALVNAIRDLRDSLNASPAFWSSLDESDDDWFESFAILGIYRKFTINAQPTEAMLSIELEEI